MKCALVIGHLLAQSTVATATIFDAIGRTKQDGLCHEPAEIPGN